MSLIKRAVWGARSSVGTGNKILPNPLGVAVHYSATNIGVQSHALCDDHVRGIQRYHMEHNGWSDIAYSYLVCQHGFVYEGRGVGKGSAANGTTKANEDYYAVCGIMGPGDQPTKELVVGIGDAIDICQKAGAKSRVLGHGDLFATSCPGKALNALVKAGHWNASYPIPATVPTTPKPPTTSAKPAPKPKAKPKPTSIPVGPKRPPQIAVDGIFGTGTKKRFQTWAGVFPDGKLGVVSWMAIQRKVGHLTVDGEPGVITWKAIQKLVGATQDGAPGEKTYRALQTYLNKH